MLVDRRPVTRRHCGNGPAHLVAVSFISYICYGDGRQQFRQTDDNSSGALGAGEHGGSSHQLQSPGSNPLGVGQGGNAAEGYVAKYAAKEDTKVNRSLSAAEGYVAKYAAKEDTKMNRSLSGREMLN